MEVPNFNIALLIFRVKGLILLRHGCDPCLILKWSDTDKGIGLYWISVYMLVCCLKSMTYKPHSKHVNVFMWL